MDKPTPTAETAAPSPATITERQDALTRQAIITQPALTIEQLSLERDRAVLFRADTTNEKIRERLWRIASDYEAARKILAAEKRKAAKGGA